MYKALLIDDEQMIVKGLSKLVPWEQLGYDLIGTAFSGKSAAEAIRSLTPDVVVSDIQLGDTTGLNLIHHAKKQFPDILFIFISGYDDFSYCQRALKEGAVDYILKPVDINRLSAALTKCVGIIEDRKILAGTDRISFMAQQETGDHQDEGKLIDSIKHYIDSNYGMDIDIASISKQFYIGQTYFSELFKKEFGVNFKKYLTSIRMEKAKLYFMETDYKISDVASKVGYDDPGYFSQVFRKHTGKTPRQFKLSVREGDGQ